MFDAKNIMTKSVVSVKSDTNIYDAMNILVDKKISGLPVVDVDNNLIGILTEKDILRLLVDRDISDRQTVGDYMTSKVISFGPDDSAVTITEFLMKSPVRRVPIVEKGKLVGVVSRRDIICLLLKIRGKVHKE